MPPPTAVQAAANTGGSQANNNNSAADSSGVYIVHAVDSADRITLVVPNKNPPQFKQVILAGVVAPKVARQGNQNEFLPDEPCAHDAREYVRKKIIGKSVKFVFETTTTLQRDAGRILLPDGEDISISLCQRGLAALQGRIPNKEYNEKLFLAVDDAKRQGLGVWAPDANKNIRDVKPSPPDDAETLFKVIKEEPQKVLVERVLNGSTLILTLPAFNQQVTFHLSGIICPSVKSGQDPEPFGAEAKTHTERCLLHREINVEFDSVGSFKNFVGNVVHGTNVFQEDLLNRGLARILPTSIQNTAHRDRLRAAEKAAQEKRVGLWKDYTPPQILKPDDKKGSNEEGNKALEYSGDKQFTATVIHVMSGDTVVLLKGTESIKASLANLRANRFVTRDQEAGQGKEARVTYENFTWEAREALRTLTIGKQVYVSVDYVRVIEETKEHRPYVSLVLADSGENVGAQLLSQGLLRAFFAKGETAICADLLRDTEATAKAHKVGIYGGKEPPATRMVELGRPGEKKARQYLAYFHRGGQGGRPPRLSAVVEVVLAPTSLKVYVPKEKTQIILKLAGVTSPSGGLGDQPADPFADEARLFAITTLQGRDVEIEVETVDKFGNFLGACYVNNVNFAISIIRAGLGCVGNVDRLPYAAELRIMEKKAQDARLMIWSEGTALPAKHQRAQAKAIKLGQGSLVSSRTDAFAPVMLTELVDSTSFYMCALDADTKQKRKAVEKYLDEYSDTGKRHAPKKDELVVARFSQDGKWYRGRVTAISSDKRLYSIRYIDFGNFEERCDDDIRIAETPLIRDTPALAQECRMAYLRPLPIDYADLALESLRTYCSVPSLFARPEYTSGNITSFTISSSADGETAAQYLIQNGLGIVDVRAQGLDDARIQATLKQLLTLQQSVQRSGRNVWQYGTAIADDDEA